jgi:hypothetical protein
MVLRTPSELLVGLCEYSQQAVYLTKCKVRMSSKEMSNLVWFISSELEVTLRLTASQ